MERTNEARERILTAVLLFLVVALQFLTALSTVIRESSGRTGRMLYYTAFTFNLIHDLFTALVVPVTLLYTAVELLRSERPTETILVAVIAILWYSPERVQGAISNLLGLWKRYHVLVAALSEYHRAAVDTDEAGCALESPLRVRRRLRLWPWWSATERGAVEYWNGRVIGRRDASSQDPVRLMDAQLRAVARDGIQMALLGGFGENELRAWCAAIVADQARFQESLLEGGQEYENMKVFSGLEGRMIRRVFEEYGRDWSDEELRRLGYLANGIRREGLDFIRKEGWVQ